MSSPSNPEATTSHLATPRVQTLLLAGLRGFCAGVERAIEVVERAMEVCDGTVYVRKEIVHNRHVVETLRRKGARFVDELDEVPSGAWVVYSAHGVSPGVRAAARARRLRTVDATCPLVTKVHLEAIAYARRGFTIIFIGHDDHDETIGTVGEAPGLIRVVGSKEDAARVEVRDAERVAYLTQTTLSADDTREIVGVLKARFPRIAAPPTDDICYATQNRQDAVRMMAPQVDLLLVVGAPNSSNSLRLCEVARSVGCAAQLIERAADIRQEWLARVTVLGLTAGASAPEVLVQEVVDYARRVLGVQEVREIETVRETLTFDMPHPLKLSARRERATLPSPAPADEGWNEGEWQAE
jgi:4-hydroxy-3-methylbut-2-enyl diphosphate reductase